MYLRFASLRLCILLIFVFTNTNGFIRVIDRSIKFTKMSSPTSLLSSLSETGRNKHITTKYKDKLAYDVYKPDDKDTGECVLCKYYLKGC